MSHLINLLPGEIPSQKLYGFLRGTEQSPLSAFTGPLLYIDTLSSLCVASLTLPQAS